MVHDLYQETILDHSKHPRNCHELPGANRKAEGYNPLCGDKLKLYLKMNGDVVEDASFVGSGCAISTASASLMTESLKGLKREEALKLLEKFHDLLTTDSPVTQELGIWLYAMYNAYKTAGKMNTGEIPFREMRTPCDPFCRVCHCGCRDRSYHPLHDGDPTAYVPVWIA